MLNQSEPRIMEFHAGNHQQFPAPFPAARAMPDWMKQVPGEVSGPNDISIPTLKKCPPLVEAMTCGYVVPLPYDVRFHMHGPQQVEFHSSGKVVETQPAPQYKGTPFENMLVIKFLNPWTVKTPPGYSTLFLPVLNRFSMPFQVLSGLVETDTYYREVNFPAICLMRPGQTYEMKRGDPIAQVIPFKRDPWEGKPMEWDYPRRLALENEFAANSHLYKEQHWVRKVFT